MHLKPPEGHPQTALQPGEGTAGEFSEDPIVWNRLFLSFFQRGRVIAGLCLPDPDTPAQGERPDQQQAIQAIRGA